MITAEDCFDFSELSIDAIEAIAEHEHIPPVVAAEVGYDLLHRGNGAHEIFRFIAEDIQHAEATGHHLHALELQQTLTRFRHCHC